MNAPRLRPSPIAGTWYPANPEKLAASIDGQLSEAVIPELDSQIIAIVAPHAGHRYSGRVAAHAFAALRGHHPELIVVVSPYHNYDPHPLLTTAHEAYATPLGNIDVDKIALADLQSQLPIPIATIANDPEHSLEIELPFLQRVFSHDFKLLPLMIRAQEEQVAHQLGGALAAILQTRNALLVASTDLSHFYDQKTANNLDREMLRCFESLDPPSIFRAEQTGKGYACGHAAVAAVEWVAKHLGANRAQILNYATSGDVTGDYSSVVGYGAVVITKQ